MYTSCPEAILALLFVYVCREQLLCQCIFSFYIYLKCFWNYETIDELYYSDVSLVGVDYNSSESDQDQDEIIPYSLNLIYLTSPQKELIAAAVTKGLLIIFLTLLRK